MSAPRRTPRRAPDLTVLGATGLRHAGGYVLEEYQRELAGLRGIRTYREMRDSDPVVGAVLFAIENLLRQVVWRATPADDSAEAQAQAAFVEGCLHDMSASWEETVADILSFLPYGWSWCEIVYKLRGGDVDDPAYRSRYDDGRIGWRAFAIRAQDSLLHWVFDEEGGVQAMVQQAPPTYRVVTIPIDRSLLFRTTSARGNPEGRSILRNAYRPWYLKRHVENIEGIGIERDLAGLPVAHVPVEIMYPDAGEEERAALEAIRQIVTSIRRDEQEGVVMPSQYDERGNPLYRLELLSTGGQRQFDTDRVIARYDQRIAMSMLADFILLGHEQVGSFALSSDKTALFAVALRAFLGAIRGVLNSQAVPRLMRLNGVEQRLWPTLEHGDIEDADLGRLGAYISALAGAGFPLFPNEPLQDRLLELAGLPTPPGGWPEAGGAEGA